MLFAGRKDITGMRWLTKQAIEALIEGVLNVTAILQQAPCAFGASRSMKIGVGNVSPSAVLLRNATPSVFHQRHIGRVLRSSCNVRGRRLASSRDREPRPGRCPPVWPGDLRNDGGSVPAAGADGNEARLDGTLRPDDRRGKKYVVSSTLDRVDWNAERVRGDLGNAVQQLKRESGKGLLTGGVTLPLAWAGVGLIAEYEFVVHPRLAGQGPTLFAGLSKRIDLKLVGRMEF